MSDKRVCECDRCGQEIFASQNNWLPREAMNGHSARIQLWKPEDLRSSPGQRIDLCEECFHEFIKFMESAN